MSKRIPCKRCSGKGYIYVTYSEGNTGTATSHICPECCGAGVQFVPSTNADRVRSMSDEELAKFLDMCESRGYEDSSIATDSGGYCMDMLEWLQQPAEDDQRRTERRC